MSFLLPKQETEHRPWPPPRRSWGIKMIWHDLLFLHWPIEPSALRPHIPEGLEVDTFEGAAWISVVPFRMSGIRPRFAPAVPKISAFPEINLRTYVTAGGRAGVWFFSLDVTSRLAVLLARRAFHLPYFKAHMQMAVDGDWIDYSSRRIDGGQPFGFTGKYRGDGDVYRAGPGSIDYWLTERYCLYSANRRGQVFRGEVHHKPWPLERAAVEVSTNTLPDMVGLSTGSTEPLAHFARRLDVLAWTIEKVD